MGRQPRDKYTRVTVALSDSLCSLLDEYCQIAGQSRSTAVERLLYKALNSSGLNPVFEKPKPSDSESDAFDEQKVSEHSPN